MVGQRRVGLEGVLIESRVPFFYGFLFNYAPARLVVVGPEIPLVVHVGLRFPGFEFATGVVIVQKRSVTFTRLGIGRRSAGFFHDVLGEHAHVTVDFALLGIQFQLRALLKQLLQHLLGHGLRLALFSAVGLQLRHELDHLRLEISAVVHWIRGLVRLSVATVRRGVHPSLKLVNQRLVIFFREVAWFFQVLVFELVFFFLLIRNARDDLVGSEGRFGGIFHVGFGVTKLMKDA